MLLCKSTGAGTSVLMYRAASILNQWSSATICVRNVSKYCKTKA